MAQVRCLAEHHGERFAAYNGEFRRNAESHQLSAGARFNW